MLLKNLKYFGILHRKMFSSSTKIRVRYGETDQMGYLYYGNYALYYEVGRVEAIRELGFPYKDLEDYGIILPVSNFQSKFIRPAYYDDLITVRTLLKEIPKNHNIEFHSELYNSKEELINLGMTTLVVLDRRTKSKTELPSLLLERINGFFQP
ncbi:MAG: acyl-CoA thioesterase [Chitinophagaceae bacterium]